MTTIWASSGYGANTRQPFVTIHWKDTTVQLTPEDARRFALSLIEASEAAEQDGFLVEWTKAKVGFDDNAAAALLSEYRIWREARVKKEEVT